jgi:hypothetical protein
MVIGTQPLLTDLTLVHMEHDTGILQATLDVDGPDLMIVSPCNSEVVVVTRDSDRG